MKPLNPILNQILQERFQVSALKPPRIRTARLEVPQVKPVAEIPRWEPVRIETTPSGTPKARVNFDIYPETPRTTIIDIITATEKRNPALVKQEDFSKLTDYLNIEVESAIQRTGSSNYDNIWKEVTKANPAIVSNKSETVLDALDDVITFKIQPPVPMSVDVQSAPEIKAEEPKVQPMPTEDEIANVQPEQTTGDSVKSAIPALLPMLLPALQTVPIRKTNDKVSTRAKTRPGRNIEDEQEEVGPTGTEIQRQKEMEAELEKPFRFDQDDPALELEKNLGKYGGTYVRR